MIDRRTFLAGATAVLGCPAAARAPARGLTISLLGQSLIQHDICGDSWQGRAALTARLARANAVFSDLETAIRGPRAGLPTRNLETLHVADPIVIGCLKRLGINLLATSNNHAFDVGTGGIEDSLDALQSYGLVHSGTGRTLAEASGPNFLPTEAGSVALVSFATGMVRDGGAATAVRAGVAEVRRGPDGRLEQADVDRTLAAVRVAAASADLVIAYQHNHYWESDNSLTPEWQRALARQLVDSGASLFVGHGAPRLQGVELYRGRPLFYGLGSFIFQTRKGPDAYEAPAWESLIAECRFSGGRFVEAELIPLQLNAVGEGGHGDLATRGRPRLARGREARLILQRMEALSAVFGYRLQQNGRRAFLRP